jgi:exodeoxyribonuclease VII large subunit
VADRVDVVILARGGGSLEDLWCFNDEGLARAVGTCRVPVVSAIGHETDVTIVDFVADVRAPTPSAAAELVSPDAVELTAQVDEAGRLLAQEIREILSVRRGWVKGLGERMSPRGLRRSVDANRVRLQEMRASLASLGAREIVRHRERLGSTGRRLDLLSPLATLQRGYAIAEREDGHVVAHAADVVAGDPLAVRFQDGRIHVYVNDEAPK